MADISPALLEAWYPWTAGGDAVADILFGKVNPGGKLPMSFPVNVGQIPISYSELPTGRPFDPNNKYTSKYLDVPNAPQYPFGFGLSYTTFSLSSPHLSSTSVSANGPLQIPARLNAERFIERLERSSRLGLLKQGLASRTPVDHNIDTGCLRSFLVFVGR